MIGASSNRNKFGNKAFRAFQAEGHKVIPINPNEQSVEGVATYPSVMQVPEKIDMATVYVPPDIGITLLDGFEKKQIAEIWINPGAESDELIAEARTLLQDAGLGHEEGNHSELRSKRSGARR